MAIVREVMGRSCSYRTAAMARHYRAQLSKRSLVPGLGLHFERLDVHASFNS